MTPLVTVTHYLSHPPSSRCESDLIVVMSVCCKGNPKTFQFTLSLLAKLTPLWTI